jgi:hypothetical protein
MDGATAAALKIGPFLRKRQILTATDLSDAVRGCDTYVKAKVVFGQMALGYKLSRHSRVSLLKFFFTAFSDPRDGEWPKPQSRKRI